MAGEKRPQSPCQAQGLDLSAPSGRISGGEEVLVVERAALLGSEVLPQGFSGWGWDRFLDLVARRGAFVPRDKAEENPSLKQVIPYAVVTFQELVFLFQRTVRGGEARLHGKFSIGVGGHINPEGVGAERLVEAGLRRELSEELVLGGTYDHRPIGLINDDEAPVGRVHVGIVYLVKVFNREVRVRETEVLEGGFVSVETLGPHLPRMESWSRYVAEAILHKAY